MTSLTIDSLDISEVQAIEITDDPLSVDLSDGRTISVPLAWYLRLLYRSVEKRQNWRFMGNGEGIHWNHLDEDASVKNIGLGQPLGESQKLFQRWLNQRHVVS